MSFVEKVENLRKDNEKMHFVVELLGSIFVHPWNYTQRKVFLCLTMADHFANTLNEAGLVDIFFW
jgi:hypothetical protein